MLLSSYKLLITFHQQQEKGPGAWVGLAGFPLPPLAQALPSPSPHPHSHTPQRSLPLAPTNHSVLLPTQCCPPSAQPEPAQPATAQRQPITAAPHHIHHSTAATAAPSPPARTTPTITSDPQHSTNAGPTPTPPPLPSLYFLLLSTVTPQLSNSGSQAPAAPQPPVLPVGSAETPS